MLICTAGTASLVAGLGLVLALAAVGLNPQAARPAMPYRGLHLLGYNTDSDLQTLGGQIPALAALGVNTIILEVDYSFRFESHPELRARDDGITPAAAGKLTAVCKQHGIRLIPQFQCLGHQSWKEMTFPLLTRYPELDLTPGAFPKNQGIYCREWDPLNPKVNAFVFPLLDEILAGFQADAFHVGMDEVFLIGSEHAPSTKGKDPARVFAQTVNDLHKHLVGEKQVEMLMWSDRLFDATRYEWGELEAAKNGTAGALDLIPKDIILCPWHYEQKAAYPSVALFVDKGFRVLPASWKDRAAARALMAASHKVHSPRMLGHLFTTWGDPRKDAVVDWPPLVEGLKELQALERK